MNENDIKHNYHTYYECRFCTIPVFKTDLDKHLDVCGGKNEKNKKE